MTSFQVMRSSNSRNSDLSRRISSSSSIRPQQQFRRDLTSGGSNDGLSYSSNSMTVEGILHDTFASDPPAPTESSLLDASITLMDASPAPMEITTTVSDVVDRDGGGTETTRGGKSVDEVWREMVSGEGKCMKEETQEEIMTLEDFLAKAAVEDETATAEDLDVKIPLTTNYGFDHSAPPHNPFQMIDKVEGSIVAFGNGLDVYGGGGGGSGGVRGKRARVMVEPLDKAAAQRQRRMIKNRESAARSRERKQAYQVELEALAAKLEEENELLSKEIEEKRKERYQKLMEFVIPVVEKPKQQPPRFLRRIRSLEW
ncbi:Basic-leucine zipper domain [Arabidopsis thaliana x Arabidopsis arenosa]|uniref:Basic-leucine zipper domain n=1 Tax=Arabidopsis thaliana x Arabidopsis arenosa TaxID=1240361 RepID=A0A8T1XKK8_9BRAS|nr:Basic-leucine zipper domain [Arabidopsis thaliana x Arabidopsis arenosa]